MPDNRENILVLALGNDVMGDDAIGLHAARLLRSRCDPSVVIREAVVGGFELMELMEGFDRVLILDAIVRGAQPGTIHMLTADDFRSAAAGSPHTVGLPEVLQLAERLGIPFPSDIRILAVEIGDPYVIREGLSREAELCLPVLADRAAGIVASWCSAGNGGTA